MINRIKPCYITWIFRISPLDPSIEEPTVVIPHEVKPQKISKF